MKKTTVEISDDLLKAAREVAHKDRITFRQLLEQGLRLAIQQRRKKVAYQYRPVVFHGNGLIDAFQDRDWNAIRDASYEGRGS